MTQPNKDKPEEKAAIDNVVSNISESLNLESVFESRGSVRSTMESLLEPIFRGLQQGARHPNPMEEALRGQRESQYAPPYAVRDDTGAGCVDLQM